MSDSRLFLWRLRLPLSLAVCALLLLAAAPGPVSADTVTETIVPVPQNTVNPCNGEPVVGSGRIKMVLTATTSASGNTNTNIHTEQFFNGVGAITQSNYVSSQTDDLSNTGNGSTFKFDIVTTYLITSKGPAPNYFLHVLIHATVVNGVPRADSFDVNEGCNG